MLVLGRFVCFIIFLFDIKNILWNYYCILIYLLIYIVVFNCLIKFVMKLMIFYVFNINVVFFRYNMKKDVVKYYLIFIYIFYLLDFFFSGFFDIWCIVIMKV